MKAAHPEWFGIVLIVIIGVIHLILVPGEYEETPYMGMLFAANFAGALLAAVGLYRNSLWGWLLGFVVAAGAQVGYLLSRTVGLPGMEIESWLDPYGIISLVLEALFIIIMFQKTPWQGVRDGITV